ncbi:MAG: hypothetical protein QOH03_5546 [Kribbellaceae bacterium]|nr:hypothetical protein [Kribbellaceae bacterium]
MPLTPQDVHSKVFGPTRFRRGYDEAEVDAFLDEVEAELLRLHREIDGLRSQLGFDGAGSPSGAQDASSVAPEEGPSLSKGEAVSAPATRGDGQTDDSGDLEQRVARTLVLAQRAADEALRDAETQAEQMRLAAQAEVERLRAESQAAAERLRADSEATAARERAALESERTSAEDDVEQLRAFEREYRTRLRAYLELQLRELDSSGAAAVESQPTPALPGEAGNAPTAQSLSGGGQPSAGPVAGDEPATAGMAPVGSEQPYDGAHAASYPDGHADGHVESAQYAAGGVSDRPTGEEQGHEPPRDAV